MGKRILLHLVLLGAACASTYGTMRPAREIPQFHRLAERGRNLHNRKLLVKVREVDGEPVRLAVRETREVGGDRLVVLIHGVLSDSRAWDYVTGALGPYQDLLVVDLCGCGKSDKPDPARTGPDGYSPTRLARDLYEVLRSRSAARERPPRFVLVGHSLGAMVVLRMLGDKDLRREYADVLPQVERAVLLSPVDFAVERVHPVFEQIVKLSPLEVGVGKVTGILLERLAKSVLEAAHDPDMVPREEVDRLYEILGTRDTLRSGQAMLRQAVPFRASGRPDWDRIDLLVQDYRNVDRPVYILAGARDETFNAAMSYKLHQQLKDSWLYVFKECKHALPSQVPQEIAERIRTFILTGGRGIPRYVEE